MMVEHRGVQFDDAILQSTVREGADGPSVVALQALLNSHGAPFVGRIDGDFGPKTREAVLWFQRANNLKPDAEVGPYTCAALIRRASELPVTLDPIVAGLAAIANPKAKALMETAAKELGRKEIPDGSNDGPEVDKYTDDHAEPWCADFVSWCLKQQAWNPLPRRQPSCSGLARWGQTKGTYFATGAKDPEPGDVFLQLQSGEFGVDTGHSHTGFVLSYDPVKKEVTSIEGNAGNAVRSYQRTTAHITGFVRMVIPAPDG